MAHIYINIYVKCVSVQAGQVMVMARQHYLRTIAINILQEH